MDAKAQRRLELNLQGLMGRQPAVAQRICLSVDDRDVNDDDLGEATIRFHSDVLPLTLPKETRRELIDGCANKRPVLLLGAGDGTLAARLLDRAGKAGVQVWDRDPAVVRVLLASEDLREPIRRGRLTIHMGADLVNLVGAEGDPEVVWHPTARRMYRMEARLVEDGAVSERRAMVCTGGLFVDDLAEALRTRGYSVVPLELVRISTEEVDHGVRTVGPELVSGINYVRGTEGLADRHKLPVLCWEIDPTTDRILPPEAETEHFRLFTYRDAAVEGFQGAGFQHVQYHPLAANPERRRPLELTEEDRQRFGAKVAYVGSSMSSQARVFLENYLKAYAAWRGGPQYVTEGKELAQRVLTAQRADLTTYRVPELMGEHLGDFVAALTARNPRVDVTMWLGEIAAMEKRLALVSSLAPFGAVAYGDPGWQAVVSRGVEHRGRVAHGTDLTKAYCAAEINVDIGRIYQSDIVTMRVFDVLSCGAFLLAEHNEAIAELLEVGVEVETWRTPQELKEKVAWYLTHPEERLAMAQRGMEAVRERHTIQLRVDEMLSAVDLP